MARLSQIDNFLWSSLILIETEQIPWRHQSILVLLKDSPEQEKIISAWTIQSHGKTFFHLKIQLKIANQIDVLLSI